jgi:hypothetical protein
MVPCLLYHTFGLLFTNSSVEHQVEAQILDLDEPYSEKHAYYLRDQGHIHNTLFSL